ncbi:MAG: hydroxysqualene dehydroxylase HpnE [Gammaproteobacteria bacterium]|nr:hydroxysqualene dehydroxylase HpnE [Gammaproteobacteria bacterium]
MPDKKPVTIIGAGWAGLAAGIKLSKLGFPVTLIESARQIGGRARSIPFNQSTVDNGQHLMIGAYKSILDILNELGIDENEVLTREKMILDIHSLKGNDIRLKAPKLPAPLHLLVALITAKGFNVHDRLSAMRFGTVLFFRQIKLKQDISVEQLLRKYKQTNKLIHSLWEPLCLATLNTPLDTASAEIFLRVLQNAFLKHQQDADLLIPRQDLGKLFPEPAMDFIEKNHGQIKLGQRVTQLKIEAGQIKGYSIGDEDFNCENIILAIAPQSLPSLLDGHSSLTPIHSAINQFAYEPVTTIYIQYPESVKLKQPMLGLIDSFSQWIFDRRVCGQPGLMAIVISSRGAHMQEDKDRLADIVKEELAQFFPNWPEAIEHLVIREKRATFSSSININRLRPANQTNIKGLWLAGDYTHTGYPATLEGAVRSGLQCAEQIINETYT